MVNRARTYATELFSSETVVIPTGAPFEKLADHEQSTIGKKDLHRTDNAFQQDSETMID